MVGKVYENSIVMGGIMGCMGYRIMGHGTWDMGYGIWDMGYGMDVWDIVQQTILG